MSAFKHFHLDERERIEDFLAKGKSRRFVAKKLGRSVSSVSDEIQRNSVKGRYAAKKAEHKAYVKRKYSKSDCMKVVMNEKLQRFVRERLGEDQSPEGISGRLRKVEKDIQYASTKAIYKFVHSVHGRQIEKCLYSKAVKRKSGPKRGSSVAIDGRKMIDKRPRSVEKRREFGHYEGDFIESGYDGKGSLLVLVERKTRYPFIKYLENRKTEHVNRLVQEMVGGHPIQSLTIDNDISFRKHKELSGMIEADVFFCHPHSPYEKGTIENRNKAIRRYVGKRSDLSQVSEETLSFVLERLRNKYMKCLDYRTPREAFEEELEKVENKKTAKCGIITSNILLEESVRIGG